MSTTPDTRPEVAEAIHTICHATSGACSDQELAERAVEADRHKLAEEGYIIVKRADVVDLQAAAISVIHALPLGAFDGDESCRVCGAIK